MLKCYEDVMVMTSPGGVEYHDYQHYVGGQSHSNFASVFTCCDYIYGTDMGYRYQKKIFTKKCPFGIVLTGDNSTKPLIVKLTSPC